jgi:hypothetical protein
MGTIRLISTFDFERADDAWCDWRGSNALNRAIMVPGVLNIMTARNMTVPLVVEIHPAAPAIRLEEWDHVVEAGLQIDSGVLVVSSPLGIDVATIPVTPGSYVARVSFAGLHTLSEDGLKGADHYLVQLWPGVAQTILVLKRDQ